MDSQELNRACELAFRVAREGVEQDPPIDPPAPMRMFLYVRQYPQRALTVARQVLSEDEEFRTRVAAEATEDNVGASALAWLNGEAELTADGDGDAAQERGLQEDEAETNPFDGSASEAETASADVEDDGPVTKESIRSEMDELKSLVGQLSTEREAVGTEVEGLAGRLEQSEDDTGLSSALASATAAGAGASTSSSLTTQIRSLHADLKHARSERDLAQEAKELAILEHAELAEELESLRSLAGSAKVQLTDLEAKVDAVSNEKAQLESEKNQLAAERESLSSDKDSLSAEVQEAAAKLAASEEKLAAAEGNLQELTTELEQARSSAGTSVNELQAAIAARAAMESHVDALGGAQAKAQAEMERVNSALSDRNASDAQKIETLKVALASVTAERDALQAKLESVRATVTSLQGEMAKLDTNMTDAESVANVLNERMEELQSSVEAMPADHDIVGDLSQFETPDAPEYTAPASFAAPAAIPAVADDDDVADIADHTVEDTAEDPAEDTVEDTVENVEELDIEAETAGDESDEATDTAENFASVPTMLDEAPGQVAGAAGFAGAAAFVAASAGEGDHDAPGFEADMPEVPEMEVAEVDAAFEIDTPDVPEMDIHAPDADELVPDEMIPQMDANDFIPDFDGADIEVNDVSPLVMSDTADVVDHADAVAIDAEIDSAAFEEALETEIPESELPEVEFDDAEMPDVEMSDAEMPEAPEVEDIDEVHALVAETVASFEPSETDDLPGSGITAEAAADAGASADRGGLTSLFSNPNQNNAVSDAAADVAEESNFPGGGVEGGLLAAAGVGVAGAAAGAMGATSETLTEQLPESVEAATMDRGPISVPGEIAADSLASARHIVNTENAVLLIDGDPVAAMGWPSVDRVEQRRNLVHYLSVMAGTSGAAPDVLLDRDFGIDRLPDSRSVRVRVTNESGSVSAQIVSLIDTYPTEWPVVVVTDNMDLAAEAAMKGATLLDNGQLLDLFIAP